MLIGKYLHVYYRKLARKYKKQRYTLIKCSALKNHNENRLIINN